MIAIIKPLLWDTQRPPEIYLEAIKKRKAQRTSEEDNLAHEIYIKIINFNYWRNIRQMFSMDRLKTEVLDDEIIQGLFPRPLREDYRFVKRVLSAND